MYRSACMSSSERSSSAAAESFLTTRLALLILPISTSDSASPVTFSTRSRFSLRALAYALADCLNRSCEKRQLPRLCHASSYEEDREIAVL